MERTRQGLRRMELFEEIYDKYQSKVLSCTEAGELLGISERSFRRWKRRYEADGASGLLDKRVGRPSNRRAQDSETRLVNRLYDEKYRGFNVSHYHHYLVEHHGFSRSYSFVQRALEKSGLITKSKRGGDHRLRRPRRPMEGMMLHQDASRHQWFGDEYCDLVVTMDDATSEITSAFFCAEEGTNSSLRGIRETIEKKGIFCTLYSDRGSHYWYTPEAGGKVDKSRLTQVGRALQQLGIQHIAAYSPQARGRSERMFGTLQGRLVQELKLHGISTMEAANAYLQQYLIDHNKQFMVEASDARSAYLPYVGRKLDEIFCVQEKRVVSNDNTISYNGRTLQIPRNEHRYHYVKCEVMVHHRADNSLAIFYGTRCLAEFDGDGKITIKDDKLLKATG